MSNQFAIEIDGVVASAVPQLEFVPSRSSLAAASLTPNLSTLDVLGRAEEIGLLTFEQYCQLSQHRILTERQKYARYVVRRVLFWAERMRAPVNKKVEHWYTNGFRTVNYRKVGNPKILDAKTIYNDWRVMRELPLVLRNYQCPAEHLKSVETLIRLKLAVKWGVGA